MDSQIHFSEKAFEYVLYGFLYVFPYEFPSMEKLNMNYENMKYEI